MDGAKVLNLVARFVLKMFALWALGYWGFHVGDSDVIHWILGIGAPAGGRLPVGQLRVAQGSVSRSRPSCA